MPDVRNCRKCGKIYNHAGGTQICPACRQLEEEDFKRVKDYLYHHPGASITQVSTELDIGMDKIKRFLRDGRLEITGDAGNLLLECEKCGRSIKSGRFCTECESNLAAGLTSAAGRLKQDMQQGSRDGGKGLRDVPKGQGMRYLHKEEGK